MKSFIWIQLSLACCLPIIPRAQVVLSEFQAANSRTLRDEDGDFEDWIEVSNPGPGAIDLKGWSLTDDPQRLSKWSFPATNLPAGGALVVFASNKDRRLAGNELHTNFRLSADGEYLALVSPDGKTVATEFAPVFTPQPDDVSYGFPAMTTTNLLIGAGSFARYLVPDSSALDSSWMLPALDDAAWSEVRLGVGYGVTQPGPTHWMQTDVGEGLRGINGSAYLRIPFSAAQLDRIEKLALRIRYNDGFLAYLNGSLVAARNAPVAAEGGILADSAADWLGADQQGGNNWYYGFYAASADPDGTYDPEDDFVSSDPQWQWNGAAWVLGPANPPWDSITADGWQPNGSNSGGSHWVIRRWVSETDGTVECQLAFAKQNVTCGSGATLHVYRNGVEQFGWTLAYNDARGVRTNLVFTGVAKGDLIDFALDPLGNGGSTTDLCDAATFSAVFQQMASAGPAWDSLATGARSAIASMVPEEIDLGRHRDLLRAGENLLAIQGLNRNAADSTFLVAPELVVTSRALDRSKPVYFLSPSPGAMNGAGTTNLGPYIREVQHAPNVPGTNDPVVVRATVLPTLHPVTQATLHYTVMFGPEATVEMLDDGREGDATAGDNVFSARIPAGLARAGQMLRYYITAADPLGNQTRAPASSPGTVTPQFFGTVTLDPSLANSTLPVLHWFIRNPGAADSDATVRCSMFYRGEFYDNVGVNVHGQSTRGFPKKSYDLDFPGDHTFRWSEEEDRVSELNLLTTWADKSYLRNVLAYETYADTGVPAHFAFPVRVQRNGTFFSVANVVENGNGDFLERVGLDRHGALYKMYNSAESTAQAEKKTRKSEDMQDLQALIAGLSQTSGSARRAFMFDNLDLPEIINFLATRMLTADVDCCHKNYYLYRDSEGSGEWQAMPWDVDLSFGRVWTCANPCLQYFDPVLYTDQAITLGSGNRVFTPIHQTPATRQMLLRRLRTLMDQWLQPPGTSPQQDYYRLKTLALRDAIAPDAALDLAKWGTWGERETITQAVDRIWGEFLPGRRNYLFRQLSLTNRGEIPLPQPARVTRLTFGALEFRPTSGQATQEWLSLTNANDFAVDLSGWTLAGSVQFQFKGGTVIPANSGLIVSPDASAFRRRSQSPKGGEERLVVGPYSGDLSARGGQVTLTDSAGTQIATREYAGAPSAAQESLRITELFYNPDPLQSLPGQDAQSYEFIELRNFGEVTLELRGLRFTKGVQFDFSTGAITQLPPGSFVLVVKDRAAFAKRYGTGWPVAGEFTGNLDNAGERLRLEDSFGETILDFAYEDGWFASADGRGRSLVIAEPVPAWDAWGQQESWRAGSTAGGSPGWTESSEPGPPSRRLAVQLEPNGYVVRYSGTPGKQCEFQRSPDLVTWESLPPVSISANGIAERLEPLATAPVYYRVREF